MDDEKMVCWDLPCIAKGYPICCYDCDERKTCEEACNDEHCRGDFIEAYQTCGNCKWHYHEDIDDGYVCVNDSSPFLAEWTEHDDTCDEWEERT